MSGLAGKRLYLGALLLLGGVAGSQEPASEAPDSMEVPDEAPSLPPEQAPAPSLGQPARRPDAAHAKPEEAATAFFHHLVTRNASALARSAALPFSIEGRPLTTEQAVLSFWQRELGGRSPPESALGQMEILTPAQMESKYGPPPPRLSSFPWKQPKTVIAVARLSGHAAVLLLRQDGAGYVPTGYHD
ncbi:MAG TPA: hypothetical protein VEY30_09065 [Myxococcaceae bacterium]|nr:hypothetical protein [Myxococcaceae bacterium]